MRIIRATLAAVLAATLSVSVALAAWTYRVGTVNATPETTLVELIKAEHLRVCGKELTLDSQLVWAARYKAMDMGYRNTMSHSLVDGKRVWDFYAQAGVPKTYGAGEILAWKNYPDEQSGQVAYTGWMGSSTHRAVIRNCDYDRFGIGAFQTKGGTEGQKWYAGEFTNVAP